MFFRKKLERRLESEIEYHIERVTQSYMAQGMDPHEARRRAHLEFGGATQIREDLRDVHRWRWLADLRQDLADAAHAAAQSGISGLRGDDAGAGDRREYRHFQPH